MRCCLYWNFRHTDGSESTLHQHLSSSNVYVVAIAPTNCNFVSRICCLIAKLVVLCPDIFVKALYNEGVLYQLARLVVYIIILIKYKLFTDENCSHIDFRSTLTVLSACHILNLFIGTRLLEKCNLHEELRKLGKKKYRFD